jgi:CRP-like cAMP-binding protein
MEFPSVSGTTRFFRFLEASEEDDLFAAAVVKEFAAGQMVIDQDVASQSIFLIEEGAVRVERQDRGAMVPLAVLEAGEFFGEMSFVDGLATSARIVAEKPTRVRIIDPAMIDTLAQGDQGFSGRLYRSIAALLAQRLRLTSMRVYADQSWG